MEALGTRRIVRIGLIAVLYALLTLAVPAFSYGNVQVRLAEVLMVMCLFSKDAILAVTMGCFAANVFGPYGAPDVLIGTAATLVTGILIYLPRKRIGVIVSALISAAVNAPAVSLVILLNNGEGDFLTNIVRIAASEFLTVAIAGSLVKFHLLRLKKLKKFFSDSDRDKPRTAP